MTVKYRTVGVNDETYDLVQRARLTLPFHGKVPTIVDTLAFIVKDFVDRNELVKTAEHQKE